MVLILGLIIGVTRGQLPAVFIEFLWQRKRRLADSVLFGVRIFAADDDVGLPVGPRIEGAPILAAEVLNFARQMLADSRDNELAICGGQNDNRNRGHDNRLDDSSLSN